MPLNEYIMKSAEAAAKDKSKTEEEIVKIWHSDDIPNTDADKLRLKIYETLMKAQSLSDEDSSAISKMIPSEIWYGQERGMIVHVYAQKCKGETVTANHTFIGTGTGLKLKS